MAKKGHRQLIMLVCEECKSKNYITEKNKMKTTEKKNLNKYCKFCKKVINHVENAKLK